MKFANPCAGRPEAMRDARGANAQARCAPSLQAVTSAASPPDENPTWAERRLFPAAVRLAALYGRLRPEHRRPEFKTPYVLCHGHNLALTADLYERCGGATDTPLAAGSEDVELLNRARRHTSRVVRAENMVVYNSLRRLRAWGPKRTLLWYWDRRYRPARRKSSCPAKTWATAAAAAACLAACSSG